MLSQKMRQKLLQAAREDIGGLDISSSLLREQKAFAKITANENCVLAGIEEAKFLFSAFGVKTVSAKKDGSSVKKGETVLRVFGSNKKILSVERTALNFLGRMSGVAAICARAKKIAGSKTKIFLTRKTMPLLNEFDKKACVFGGVFSHRKNLRESFLIKDNHLEFGSVEELLKKAILQKKNFSAKEVEIEAQNLKQAMIAADCGADVVLLDNFSAKNAKIAIGKIRKTNKKVEIELSGGINLKNLKRYVSLGACRVSMGELTKSAPMVDFSLEFGK